MFPLWLLSLTVAPGFLPSAQALQCYECDSQIDGEAGCNDSEGKGRQVTCGEQEASGCYITEVLSEARAFVTRGCTGETDESKYKCEVHHAGSQDFTSCSCHGDLCNSDWESASSGERLQCYQCSSEEEGEACSDTAKGELQECQFGNDKGCFISTATYGGDTVMERGCTDIADPALYTCHEVDQALHYCNCHGSGCNSDWDTAAGGLGGDTTPGQDVTVQCYECNSALGDCSLEHYGDQVDCIAPANQGCLISQESGPQGEVFVRTCSASTEGSKCVNSTTEDIWVHLCECVGDLCNQDFSTADQGDSTTEAPGDTIQCFQCDSVEGGQCDGHYPGEKVSCPAEDGCLISYESSVGDNIYLRGCALHGTGQGEHCDRVESGESSLRFCVCLSPLCNEDWQSAGSTAAPPTSQGPTVSCYSCDSETSTCSDSEHGDTQVECPASRGCRIARNNGGQPHWVRDCSLEEEWDCEVYDNEDGGTTQSCNCGQPLCNSDWQQAGSSSTASGETTTPGPTDSSSGAGKLLGLVTNTIMPLVVVGTFYNY